jgi:ribosomal protein L28
MTVTVQKKEENIKTRNERNLMAHTFVTPSKCQFFRITISAQEITPVEQDHQFLNEYSKSVLWCY